MNLLRIFFNVGLAHPWFNISIRNFIINFSLISHFLVLSHLLFRDAGSPLYLTPYIESGDIETGRELARVTEPLDGLAADEAVESFAGFFTVRKETNSNMFFWFFPATVKLN